MWQVCRGMPTYPNAYAKVKKWIFDVRFPGNCFEFDMILNDFWSSTFWAIQIKVSFTEFKNPKNPGIQHIYLVDLFWPQFDPIITFIKYLGSDRCYLSGSLRKLPRTKTFECNELKIDRKESNGTNGRRKEVFNLDHLGRWLSETGRHVLGSP